MGNRIISTISSKLGLISSKYFLISLTNSNIPHEKFENSTHSVFKCIPVTSNYVVRPKIASKKRASILLTVGLSGNSQGIQGKSLYSTDKCNYLALNRWEKLKLADITQ